MSEIKWRASSGYPRRCCLSHVYTPVISLKEVLNDKDYILAVKLIRQALDKRECVEFETALQHTSKLLHPYIAHTLLSDWYQNCWVYGCRSLNCTLQNNIASLPLASSFREHRWWIRGCKCIALEVSDLFLSIVALLITLFLFKPFPLPFPLIFTSINDAWSTFWQCP